MKEKGLKPKGKYPIKEYDKEGNLINVLRRYSNGTWELNEKELSE